MSKLRSAQVLLKLLKHTSAERLEVMLDPLTLLGILVEHGRSKADVEAKLKKGMLPGELLLELFEEHDADEIWEELPPRVQSKVQYNQERHEAKARVLPAEIDDKRDAAGAVVALVGIIWSGMYVLGIFPEWGQGLSLGPLTFGAVLGTLGGGWATRKTTFTAGAVAGLLSALATILSAWLAAPYIEPPVPKLLVIAIMLPGALTGLGVGTLLLRRWKATPHSF